MTDPIAQVPAGQAQAQPGAADPGTLPELLAAVQALTQRVAVLEARLDGSRTEAQPRASFAAPTVAPGADPLAEIKGLLRSLFALAGQTGSTDPEVLQAEFEAFKALVHRDRQGSPLLDGDLRKYKWATFLGRFQDYLTSPSAPDSFTLERAMPEHMDAKTEIVKVHVAVRGGRRMSPPVQFRRDPSAGNAFRIEQMSL